MNKFTIFIAMLWCHVIDDYFLQGCLAKLKQRSWWMSEIKHLDKTMYRNDYIAALLAHAFSWTCSIMAVPWLVCRPCGWWVYPLFAANVFVHARVDHAKANKGTINLVTDQCIHAVQILATWLLFVLSPD